MANDFKRLILFPGMGADARLMRPVAVPGVKTLTPDHLPPEAGESLPEYAARVASAHAVASEDVVGGASFGGMLAAEVAKQRKTRALVLLGTCVRPWRLPLAFKALYALRRVIPDSLLSLRQAAPIVRWRFQPADPASLDLLEDMSASCPPAQIRAFGQMAMAWEGAPEAPCPFLSVHGTRDRVIPAGCAEPGVLLEGAGHAFTLTHAAETTRLIGEFLRQTGPAWTEGA